VQKIYEDSVALSWDLAPNDRKKKNDEYGPVHGGDAPPFLGGPMSSQYHLQMRL
jgi:hypothetical protein